MKSAEHYKRSILDINDRFLSQISKIKADGIIDYDETVETKQLSQQLNKELTTLKKELNLELREIKAEYRVKVANTVGWRKKWVRAEQVNFLAPYEALLITIDKIIMNVGNLKEVITDLKDEFDSQSQKVLQEGNLDDVRQNDHSESNDSEDNSATAVISVEELRSLHNKWLNLLSNVATNLQKPNLSQEQIAHLKGDEKAIKIILSDFENFLG
jgi:hypothetical protein